MTVPGTERSTRVKKNIIASFGIKGFDVLVYFLLVPLTLGYLNKYEYGIWLTLNSILMWINSFDIGLGNGLRNKLAEALAAGNKPLCKIYVSTTVLMLCVLMGILMAIGTVLFPFLDWYLILGALPDSVHRLNEIVYISFALFCLNFILKFIGNIYLALQMPAMNNLLVCLGHSLSLLIIFVLSKFTEGSLLYVAVAYSVAPPLIYLIMYPIIFSGKYKYMSPSVRFFRKKHLKSLFSMGILFFVIQLGGLLLFSTANLIISHLFGPENVTPYNIAYRYFSVVAIGMNLIISPLWSAATDAYARSEIGWIKHSMKKIQKLLIIIGVGIALMILLSGYAYKIWLGDEITIPVGMTISMGVYIYIIVWSLSYSNFLNGMGKLRIQAINTIVVGLLFVPIGILLGKYLGLYGVVLSLCAANLSGAVLNTIQLRKIINNKALGIWAK